MGKTSSLFGISSYSIALYRFIILYESDRLLAKLKSAVISGHKVLRPQTKQQKDILETFQLPLPVG